MHSGHRIYTDLALCERYVDAERTQGKRASGIRKTQLSADWTQTRHTLNPDLLWMTLAMINGSYQEQQGHTHDCINIAYFSSHNTVTHA